MTLKTIMLLRVNDEMKKQLRDIALKSGVKVSALARNSIGLVLMPPAEPSMVEVVLQRIRREAEFELYGKGATKDNGHE